MDSAKVPGKRDALRFSDVLRLVLGGFGLVMSGSGLSHSSGSRVCGTMSDGISGQYMRERVP